MGLGRTVCPNSKTPRGEGRQGDKSPMPATENKARCQKGGKAGVPIRGLPASRLLSQSSAARLLSPTLESQRPRSPGCGPAGEELTPEVPTGLTVPAAAAAAASGRDEEAGAAWAPGALQSGGAQRGERAAAARLGPGRPPGGAPRRGGRGRLVWGISTGDGRARRSPAHLGESRASGSERGAERLSGAAEPPRSPEPLRDAPGSHLGPGEGTARRAAGRGEGAAATQLDRRGRGRSQRRAEGEGREPPGTRAWDSAPEGAAPGRGGLGP
ncbi:spidroin-2-like [Peromyscus californicus insignis]|uniref:spidroin-2-like n=1 Tax=Peromyscus californicus insignis TaxID=564181 RepID=UPI0022A74A99|nr:spidroin-2-like [Peromyscus californicus insignis]